jgi:DNA-binding transcriptional ArsR family regulator
MAETYLDADPKVLRAIAHPLRQALIYELYARGSATATTLGAALDKPVNSVSFHLRQLAKHGLIEVDTEPRDDGRERWWRPAAEDGLRVCRSDVATTEEGEAAFAIFRRTNVAQWANLMDKVYSHDQDTAEVWTANDVPMLLTDDEAREYSQELFALMNKWMRRGQSPADATERRTYLSVALLLPHQAEE